MNTVSVILLSLTMGNIDVPSLVKSVGGNKTEAVIIDAFAMQESSCAAKGIHMPGDNGKAWGIYQFHRSRWAECGGDPKQYGKASAKEQTRVMLNALRCYTKKWDNLTAEQKVIVAGRCHNIGHCKKSQKNKHTAYTRSIWKYCNGNIPVESSVESSLPITGEGAIVALIAGFMVMWIGSRK